MNEIALSTNEVARACEEITMAGASPNPGLAPYFGDVQYIFYSCREHEHVYHGGVAFDNGFQIVHALNHDGTVEVSTVLTMTSLVQAMAPPGVEVQPFGTTDNPTSEIISVDQMNRHIAASITREREEDDLPGHYI